MNANLWPDVKLGEKTDSFFKFVETLQKEVKAKYDGRLSCALEETKYSGIDVVLKTVSNAFSAPRKIVEEKSEINDGRSEFTMPPDKSFAFFIYNDKHFFKLFDIDIGAFFPVKIKPAEGIGKITFDGYVKVLSEFDLKNTVIDYINSEYAKRIIAYMLETTR